MVDLKPFAEKLYHPVHPRGSAPFPRQTPVDGPVSPNLPPVIMAIEVGQGWVRRREFPQ